MERRMVSEKEILSFLNSALRKADQHDSYFFDSVVKLRVEDRTGCNWAYANLKGSGDGVISCPPVAEKIVNLTRERYNLK